MVQATHPHPKRPGSSRSRFALANWRVRWRLAAIIAVPSLTAAVLGALTINSDVNNWEATGRVQHLAQLNDDVVMFSQQLEDELNVSAAFAATRPDNAGLQTQLKQAQSATDAAARKVIADSASVTTGAGYQPGTVQDLNAVLAAINDLANVRVGVTNSRFPASQIVRVFSGNLITPANTFSGAIGNGANDAELQGNVTTLGALLRNENQVGVQRAILYAALVSPQGTLRSEDLATLQQAHEQAKADLADFNASTDTAEQQYYSNTVSGAAVDVASSNEILAEQMATGQASVPLRTQLNPANWKSDMTHTIQDTRVVANQLTGNITGRANSLRSTATTDLLVTGLVTLLLLALVVMVSTIVARSLIRPLRKLRTDALDVAGHRLPEMVRRLSQSEGADEGVEIEPIGVTSTDEIGEVARAFDQVHREAVRLAADEAMLRGNLNAMFINLSRRSQSLIERQLSLIDSLEQSEQDSGLVQPVPAGPPGHPHAPQLREPAGSGRSRGDQALEPAGAARGRAPRGHLRDRAVRAGRPQRPARDRGGRPGRQRRGPPGRGDRGERDHVLPGGHPGLRVRPAAEQRRRAPRHHRQRRGHLGPGDVARELAA